MSVVQHRDMLFSVIYVYDEAGKPTWYVMAGGKWDDAHAAFTGPLHAPKGAPYTAYDAHDLVVGMPVGSATLAFNGANDVTLDYTIDGKSGHKKVTRQLFGAADPSAAPSYGDMWWGGPAQNGWGIALLQQHRTLFGVWFTYDAHGDATWLAMPTGTWAGSTTYEGRMYRASGAAWLGKAYDSAVFTTADVGFFRFRFAGDAAIFEYQVDGKGGTAALSDIIDRMRALRIFFASVMLALPFTAVAMEMPDFERLELQLRLKPVQKAQFDRAAGASKRALLSSALAMMEMKNRLQEELLRSRPDFAGLLAAQEAVVEMNRPLFREAADEWSRLYAVLDDGQVATAKRFLQEQFGGLLK